MRPRRGIGLLITASACVLGGLACVLGGLGWWRSPGRAPAAASGASAASASRAEAVRSAATAASTSSQSPVDFKSAKVVAKDGGSAGPTAWVAAQTRERARGALMAAAHDCVASPVASAARPAADDSAGDTVARYFVGVAHGRVVSLQREDGELTASLRQCVEARWRAARWDDPRSPELVLELTTSATALARRSTTER